MSQITGGSILQQKFWLKMRKNYGMRSFDVQPLKFSNSASEHPSDSVVEHVFQHENSKNVANDYRIICKSQKSLAERPMETLERKIASEKFRETSLLLRSSHMNQSKEGISAKI